MGFSSRREFVRQTVKLGTITLLSGPLGQSMASVTERHKTKMRIGLCTYLWGAHWDLSTIIANCEKSSVLGVELRVEHKHGVDLSLTPRQRQKVKEQFTDSPVTFVGLGTNQCFDSPDPDYLTRMIDGAKAFLQLSHDCGATGIKVKPNDFHPSVPHEKTIEQIGRSLNILGRFASTLNQQVRLEVHGSCKKLPIITQIMDIADHPNVAVCWNCNADADLANEGLMYNFNLVKNRLSDTLHIHELDRDVYPWQQLFDLLLESNYVGWALLECSATRPKDGIAAMARQRELFDLMLHRQNFSESNTSAKR